MTASDPVDADDQLVEHIRSGGAPDPNDPVAQLLAGMKADQAAADAEQTVARLREGRQ